MNRMSFWNRISGRTTAALFLLSFSLAPALMAQGSGIVASSIRIYTEPSGARFLVDGTTYYGSQTFTWPAGSKHIVEFPLKLNVDGSSSGLVQTSLDGNSTYGFGGWTDSTGMLGATSNVVTITADPSITFLKATVTVLHRVQIRFSSYPALPGGLCPGGVMNPGRDELRTGVLVVAGTCYASDSEVFVAAGPIQLAAHPFPGFYFAGWSINGGTASPFLRSHNLNGPSTIVAQFLQSKRIQFVTDPPGLEVLVDRSPTPTSDRYNVDGSMGPVGTCLTNLTLPASPPVSIPALCYGEFDFVPGSSHTLGAKSPQYDRAGAMWVFDKFSNGLKENEVLVVPANPGTSELLTAKFLPGVQASFNTNPANLKLDIDGRSNWLTYNFAWGKGTSHTVSAPAEQVDSKGRRWVFKSWSNGGDRTQTVVVNELTRWTANYELLPQLTIDSVPTGLTLNVDGAGCRTPCKLDRAPQAQVSIIPPKHIAISNQARLQFTGWSDGATGERTVTFGGDTDYVVANYETAYRLTVYADPNNGVEFLYEPSSADGFFAADSAVKLTAQTKGGFRFRRWDGDLAGTFNQGTVLMSAPRTVIALLERVPFIAPTGVRNAAGETPDGTVAPGSIISILGESLAPRFEEGRVNPLPQALADTTVRVGGSLLPLVFVSPTEIRAQVLSVLPEGEHTLVVRWEGQPEVSANFVISRNAPGLFTVPDSPEPFAQAIHEDGSPVTKDSPAKPGEMVSMFGTGFGPYNGGIVDGFFVPSKNVAVLDPVRVAAGDFQVEPQFAGAAVGMVGTTLTTFRVPDDMPGGTVQPVTVTVNGKASNTVLLPIQ